MVWLRGWRYALAVAGVVAAAGVAGYLLATRPPAPAPTPRPVKVEKERFTLAVYTNYPCLVYVDGRYVGSARPDRPLRVRVERGWHVVRGRSWAGGVEVAVEKHVHVNRDLEVYLAFRVPGTPPTPTIPVEEKPPEKPPRIEKPRVKVAKPRPVKVEKPKPPRLEPLPIRVYIDPKMPEGVRRRVIQALKAWERWTSNLEGGVRFVFTGRGATFIRFTYKPLKELRRMYGVPPYAAAFAAANEVYVAEGADTGVIAHEIGHALFGLPDESPPDPWHPERVVRKPGKPGYCVMSTPSINAGLCEKCRRDVARWIRHRRGVYALAASK